MAETETPEPITQAEPVALLDIAKAIVAIAGFAGITVAEHVILDVLVGVNAVIFLVGLARATRNRVTPEQRAKDREEEAYQAGLAVGSTSASPAPQAAPQATVVTVEGNPDLTRIVDAMKTHGVDITDDDIDPVAPPAPPPPRAGLLDGADVEDLTRRAP